jgi:hypothetical protein
MFAEQTERMASFLERRDTPFVIAFLKWKNRAALRDQAAVRRAEQGVRPALERPAGHWREIVDAHAVVDDLPREDGHYVHTAHRMLAARFCEVISGADDGECIPPGWARGTASFSAGR